MSNIYNIGLRRIRKSEYVTKTQFLLDESVSPGSFLLKKMLVSSGKWKFVGLKMINLDFFG